jgi:hypothetical protein
MNQEDSIIFTTALYRSMQTSSILRRDMKRKAISDESLPEFLIRFGDAGFYAWNNPLQYIVDPNHIKPILEVMYVGLLLLGANPKLWPAVMASDDCTPTVVRAICAQRGYVHDIAKLVQEYMSRPKLIQFRARVSLRAYPRERAAYFCAAVVLIADGFCVAKKSFIRQGRRVKTTQTRQFFALASMLPFDVQAILCNRIFGVSADIIPTQLLDLAFSVLLVE